MRWLVSLFDQGINGILADEMGLGKTVQSIVTLAHLAERENIWGPFLVVAPSSTLHNWEQEFRKFVPSLKVCCLTLACDLGMCGYDGDCQCVRSLLLLQTGGCLLGVDAWGPQHAALSVEVFVHSSSQPFSTFCWR